LAARGGQSAAHFEAAQIAGAGDVVGFNAVDIIT
jgi:hypothetical protein